MVYFIIKALLLHKTLFFGRSYLKENLRTPFRNYTNLVCFELYGKVTY